MYYVEVIRTLNNKYQKFTTCLLVNNIANLFNTVSVIYLLNKKNY